jgi:glycosyltransferase involved in cell wall biosynthesis
MARICVVRCHLYRDSRVMREVAALIEAGHEVVVVCERDVDEPRLERRESLTIHRLPLRHVAGAGALRLLAEYAAFFVLAAMLVTVSHLHRRFAVVQVNSVPDALVFVATVPRLTGARVLLDLQEPMPEFFMTKFGVGVRHPLVGVVAAAEQLSIRFADAAITVTEAMRRRFIERGAPPERVNVVMDGADESVFDRERRLGEYVPSADRFVLISHGTIEPQYGLDTVIEAIALLAPEWPGLQMQIFGDGSQRAQLRQLARVKGVGDRVWFSDGFVPIGELVSALASADVGVVAMRRDPFRDLTLAGKMFDFVAMGIPMIVGTTRSVEETFGEGCFEPFRSGEAHDLVRAIRRLWDEPERARKYVERATEVVEGIAWRVQRQRYRALVADLVSGKQSRYAARRPAY